jgi:hypothetical protein
MALNSYRDFDEMVVEVDAWWENTLQEFEDMMQGNRKQYMPRSMPSGQPQQPQEQDVSPQQEVTNAIPATVGEPAVPGV